MSSTLLLTTLLMGLSQAPEITELYPTPLALGSTVDITGANFEPGGTTVAIISELDPLQTPQTQELVYVLEQNVRFNVSPTLPVGEATLRVTTSEGQAEVAVEVVPEPPVLASVSPDPIVLGELATLNGSALDSVESVTLGGLECPVSAQNVSLIVCETPGSAELIGQDVPMVVSGPFGEDTLSVSAVAPKPTIESLAPNPVRQGDLLTIKGQILPHLLSVHIANQEALIVEATEGQITVAVPNEVPAGAAEVSVSIDTQSSEPAGPLWVDPADPDKPSVSAIYPSVIVAGGSAWAVGSKLDTISWSSDNLSTSECDKKACRLSFEGAEVGPLVGTLGSDDGTAVFGVQIVDEEGQTTPILTGAEPNPAFIGETLTLTGEGLFEVSHVVIGGVVQAIDYLGSEEIRVTLSELTPRGAERAFVASASASDALTLTVLDPFPTPDEPDTAAPEEDTESGTQEEDAGPIEEEEAPEEEHEEAEEEGPPQGGSEASGEASEEEEVIVGGEESSSGCQSTERGGPQLWLIFGLLAAATVTQRRRLV